MAQALAQVFPQGAAAAPAAGGALAGGGPPPMQPAPMQAPPPGAGGALAAGGEGAPPAGVMDMAAEQVQGGAAQALHAEVMQAVQQGRVSVGDLQQLGALAATALEDPRLYGAVAQMAGRMGIPIPQQPSPQVLVSLSLVAHRIGQEAGGGERQPPTQASTPPGQVPSMRAGGYIHHDAPKKGVNAVVHPGEVVVSANVVRDKGLDFFRKMHEPRRPTGR